MVCYPSPFKAPVAQNSAINFLLNIKEDKFYFLNQPFATSKKHQLSSFFDDMEVSLPQQIKMSKAGIHRFTTLGRQTV